MSDIEHRIHPTEAAPKINTPIGEGGLGWNVMGREETDAVARLLKEPRRLFRYQGAEPTQCSMLEHEVAAAIGAKHTLFVNSGTSASPAAWRHGVSVRETR